MLHTKCVVLVTPVFIQHPADLVTLILKDIVWLPHRYFKHHEILRVTHLT